VRGLKAILLAAGLALLAAILWHTDLAEVGDRLRAIGPIGFALVVAVFVAGSLIDAFTWQMTIPSAPLSWRWWLRLFNVRIAGDAFNYITPAAGMGGEPVKAALLRHYYGIGFKEGIASVILARTINVIALVAFLAMGFALMLASGAFSPAYKSAAGTGLALFALGVLVFFGIQRFKLTSRLVRTLGRHPLLTRLAALVEHLEDIDERFMAFYGRSHARFAAALFLGWVNWVLGAVEVWVAMVFLGHGVSFTDAFIIEAMAQLVRSATFLIPASIGAQEGVFLIMGTVLTGSPVNGVALAAVRRARELVMVLWGLTVFHRLKPALEDTPTALGDGRGGR